MQSKERYSLRGAQRIVDAVIDLGYIHSTEDSGGKCSQMRSVVFGPLLVVCGLGTYVITSLWNPVNRNSAECLLVETGDPASALIIR